MIPTGLRRGNRDELWKTQRWRPASGASAHRIAGSAESDRVLSVRTRVANNGGIDKSFIAIAVGVVILSAGGAIAAPSVLNMFEAGEAAHDCRTGQGLDRDEVKAALATEAFPDAEGRAFLQSLEANFPESYDRLLGRMTQHRPHGRRSRRAYEGRGAVEHGFCSRQFRIPRAYRR